MIKRLASEAPSKSGLYFCEVDRLGNKCKDVLWYSVDASAWLTGCTPDKLVAWYDDGEPIEDEQGEMISDIGTMYTAYGFTDHDWDDLVKDVLKKYIISRK